MNRPHVLTHREGAVGVMTFNRPDTMNTLDVPMVLAMEDALGALEADDAVRVLVISGCDDRTFVAGGNIADLNARRALAHYKDFAVVLHRVFRRFEECPKPTIAAVNGWALGGGAEFLLTTDIRLMADDAQLVLPEIKIGLFPGGGGSQRLMRQIPLCQAKMLMFTGDFVSAAEAVQLGLVNRAVPRAQLMGDAMALAQRIADKSPWALRLLKSSMLHGADMPLSAALAHEMATISLVLETEDAHEGCSAFLEKRQPTFVGR
ncbi:enoyl-CoA hydratase/isomerase family protein [Hydrogenophaga sp. OTU3427]|uniref:enoyl-CoA hydratase/isomerase family protein n=1 Tax=Hydrogenophaga sp. OTU3427 TaxID=3043856 RepID=UPI00313AD5AB